MQALTDIARGPGYLWQGFALIREPGLRGVVALPLAINVVLIVGLLWLFGSQWAIWLDAWLAGLPGWLAWLEAVLWWLGFLLAILLFCYAFTLLANLVAGPFNGLLSARVERHLTGREPETGLTLWGEIADGAVGEIKRLSYYLGRALLLGLVSLVLMAIPGLGALVPPLWFAFGAYMLAFEYLDAPMGNRGLPFPVKRRKLGERRWLNLGFGGAVTLVTALPLVNLVVMPAAVAGATALWLKEMEQ